MRRRAGFLIVRPTVHNPTMIYAIKLLLGLLAVLAVTFLPLRGHLARLLGAQNLSLWLKALIGATAIAFLAGRVELFMLLLAAVTAAVDADLRAAYQMRQKQARQQRHPA